MQYAVLDLCCVRVAVVRVAPPALTEALATSTIRALQPRFGIMPILLVAFDGPELRHLTGFSEFPTGPYLADLIAWNSMEPVEWLPLPQLPEPELPF